MKALDSLPRVSLVTRHSTRDPAAKLFAVVPSWPLEPTVNTLPLLAVIVTISTCVSNSRVTRKNSLAAGEGNFDPSTTTRVVSDALIALDSVVLALFA